MATTAKGIRYPVGGDTLAVHTDLQNMASDADALIGLTPLTTKGDLIAHNGSIETRLPVGSNGNILISDSSASNGVAWAAPGVGTQYIETIVESFPSSDDSTSFLFSSIPTTYNILHLNGIMSLVNLAGALNVLINGTLVSFYQYNGTALDWSRSQIYQGTSITMASGSSTIDYASTFSASTGAYSVVDMYVFDPGSTTKYKLIYGRIAPETTTNACLFIGVLPSTTAVTSIELRDALSGPIWGSSHFTLYGLRSS